MVQCWPMLVGGVQYGLMIFNGPVVQYGSIQSNGGSRWSLLVLFVCEGLSATGVKADGRLTLCMSCMPIFEDGAGGVGVLGISLHNCFQYVGNNCLPPRLRRSFFRNINVYNIFLHKMDFVPRGCEAGLRRCYAVIIQGVL